MALSSLKSLNSAFLKAITCTKYGIGISRTLNTVSRFLSYKLPTNTYLRSVGCFNYRSGSWSPSFRSTNIPKISGSCCIHTKGDQELADFLQEEIKVESNHQKSLGKIPPISGFEITLNEADVILTKKFNNETITVNFTVNHTVTADENVDIEGKEDETTQPFSVMKSQPDFLVTVEKNGKTVAFDCEFVNDNVQEPQDEPQEEFYNVFEISAIYMYEKESRDETYSVLAEIMDGDMYSLLMNFLAERGISAQFGEELIEFSSSYEHKLYINLLEKLQSFISK